MRTRRCFTLAFTLVELIIVIAIVAIISAILLPVIKDSVRQGFLSEARSNLRQFSIAQRLYVSDNDSRVTYNLAELEKGGYIAKHLLESQIDPFPLGHANAFITDMAKDVPNVIDYDRRTEFKVSYLSFGQVYGYEQDYLNTYLFPQRNVGWVIFAAHALGHDCTASVAGSADEIAGVSCGSYMRLGLDGSILNRRAGQKTCTNPEGKTITFAAPIFVFADGGDEWCRQILAQ